MRREQRDELLRSFLAINAMLREELKELKRECGDRRAEAKLNPNWHLQPRAPRGTPEGGQWIDDGSQRRDIPKQTRPRRTHEESLEEVASFFDPIDDNPYLWELSRSGLLSEQPSVAEFFNLRYQLITMRGPEFTDVARSAGMETSQLLHALNYGSNILSERAITEIERLLEEAGPGGLSIVARERRLRDSIARSGVRTEHRERMFNDILDLAGFTPREFEQITLNLGVAQQLPFLLGGGGPRSIPRPFIPTPRSSDPRYVWNLGPTTRGRIIEAALGHNLPSTFRVIDRFSDDGLATSIKSIDLGAITYHRPQTLERRLRGLIDQVAGFRGYAHPGRIVREAQITGRALDLVVPHIGTAAQQRVIDRATAYARSRGVVLNVIVYP